MLTLTAAAALFAMLALQGAHAQTSAPASADVAGTADVSTRSGAAAQAPATPTKQPPRKYASQDVERVFNYLDSDHDGKISRAEGAAFKNIASHFDGADIDKDNFLTKEEFDNAINGFKPQ